MYVDLLRMLLALWTRESIVVRRPEKVEQAAVPAQARGPLDREAVGMPVVVVGSISGLTLCSTPSFAPSDNARCFEHQAVR